jgi:uncharacterized protein (TIGR02145 family)
VSTYNDGTPIPQVTDTTAWANLTTGAWCWYNNDSNYDSVYGKLYNWYAVNDPRGLAPIGFKIPAPSDFSTLNTFLGNGISGGKLKQKGSDYWTNNIGATNSAGFYGRGTGRRTALGGFAQILAITFYWTTTGITLATSYVLQAPTTTFVPSSQALAQGFSIRCIKI